MKLCTCEFKIPVAPMSNSATIYCLLCGQKIRGADLATKEEDGSYSQPEDAAPDLEEKKAN